MKVLVAGASGFLGRHVVAVLQARGHEVVALGRGSGADAQGVIHVRCDLACEGLPVERLTGCEAFVNLVGIKRETGAQTFSAVHVEATRELLEGARSVGARRFVHVSVVCSRPDERSGYHDTKWKAEELVRTSGLPFTILRPAVVYGRGDDMITHLVKMIRFAPLFPIVSRGEALLQPVDVREVADAVAAALEREVAVGGTYDVVGPDRLTLRQIVKTVAAGTGLALRIVPTPLAVLRPLVRFMTALTSRSLSTPAQLRMLSEGMIGDAGPARRDLSLEPRRFTADVVREVEAGIPPLFGLSLRLVSDSDHAVWLRNRAHDSTRAAVLAALAIAVPNALTFLFRGIWLSMALSAAVLIPLAFALVNPGWKELFAPSRRGVLVGFAAAATLYAVGMVVFAGLLAWPPATKQVALLYGWRAALPPALGLPLLVLIVLGEEVVWRNAITLPLAGRLGSLRGVLLAATGFAAAHAGLDVPLLLAVAFLAGAFWSGLVVRARSAVPALVCHLLWDLAVLFFAPYQGV